MDMISKINPPSNKGHQYILAIMDYFTKWVEVIHMKSVTSKDVINFIKEHVIHRFGIPQAITVTPHVSKPHDYVNHMFMRL
jgi:hypothetical protein